MTEYLKERGIYSHKIIHNFLRSERVKYFIGSDKKVESKSGRHGGYTLFTEDLFELFKLWNERKPLPLLNRKEHEVAVFIKTYFPDSIRQYRVDDLFFDWYIPSISLLIEFNEKEHTKPFIASKDREKYKTIKDYRLFILNEKTVMEDLANLCRAFAVT